MRGILNDVPRLLKKWNNKTYMGKPTAIDPVTPKIFSS